MPLISVVVPVYKVEPYIHRCIDSILGQTFTDFELILVDDGSPDNCGAICDEYSAKDSRIIVIHKENGGLSGARNAGIDWAFTNSDSEWITFIDSDDWVHPKYLEVLLVLCIDNHVEVSSCGHFRFIDESIELVKVNDFEPIVEDVQALLQKGYNFSEFNNSTAWGRLYKKSLFRDVRYPAGRYHEDEFVTYKLLFVCGKIATVTIPLYYYYQNSMGITATRLSLKRMIDLLDALEEQFRYYYEKHNMELFCRVFMYYCSLVEKYSIEYGDKDTYRAEICNRKKRIKQYLKQYNDYVPHKLKKYGYKKWVSGEYYQIENLKRDIRLVKAEKGFFFSVLWAMKTRFFIK